VSFFSSFLTIEAAKKVNKNGTPNTGAKGCFEKKKKDYSLLNFRILYTHAVSRGGFDNVVKSRNF
jgi:hypothetical protein